jgi:predicted MFS family arabinose efflux permease
MKKSVLKNTLVFTIGIFLTTVIIELVFTDYSIKQVIIYAGILSLLSGLTWYFAMPAVKRKQEKEK